MKEEWHSVVGYEGLYEVSNFGQVAIVARMSEWHASCGEVRRRFIKRKVMKSYSQKSGHLFVILSKNGKAKNHRVHVLVAKAFIGPRPEGMFVCHNDGDSQNNRVDNLRYDTPRGNIADRRKHGTENTGEKNTFAKLTESQVIEIKKRIKAGESNRSIAKDFPCTWKNIWMIKSGKNWSHVDV